MLYKTEFRKECIWRDGFLFVHWMKGYTQERYMLSKRKLIAKLSEAASPEVTITAKVPIKDFYDLFKSCTITNSSKEKKL